MGRALPVLTFELDNIEVASPCSMAWADMVGGDTVRFCGACQKNVFNLSGMQRAEALELVRASEGRLCVRFFRRADGTVLTEDCPVGLRMALKRAKRLTLGALATSLGAVATLLAFLGTGALTRKTCQAVTEVQHAVQAAQGEIDPVPVVPSPPGYETAGRLARPPGGATRPPREVMGEPAPAIEVLGDVGG